MHRRGSRRRRRSITNTSTVFAVPNAQNLPQLNSAVAECMTAMSVDVLLQQNLFKQGVLFHLVQYLFNYYYTLEEGGVERSSLSNQQVPPHSTTSSSTCPLAHAL